MCGFTGFWDFHHQITDKKPVLEKMLETIKRRGPDGEGVAFIDGIAFGHKRLSIVDLTPSGAQPMYSHSRRFVMVYNGNIFNTRELKEILPYVQWRGTSDTEVILELFEKYGVEFTASQLIGMFSIVVYDRQEKNLFLVRDRLGVKPLYYGLQDQTFFFGSQVKSFLPHPYFSKTISQTAQDLFLRYNYIPAPYSIYEDIFKLEPGHILCIDAQRKTQLSQFWSMEKAAIEGRKNLLTDPKETMRAFECLLKDSISRRMVADVPVGAFLSGGVDSSLLVSLMQDSSSRPIQTFTIGFHEQEFNEAPYALKIARHLGTDHVEEYLPIHTALDIIPEIPEYCDEPFADVSQIPTLLVSKIAKKNVTVVLSGDGGDEFYGGYNRYFHCLNALKKLSFLPLSLRKVLKKSYLPLRPLLSCLIKEKWSSRLDVIHKILECQSIDEIYAHALNYWPELSADLKKSSVSDKVRPYLSDLAYMQYHDSVHYLPDDILAKVDRCSMHASLETRVPFLDHRLVEFSWRIPDNLKYQNGTTKWLLRNILYRYVPKELIERPKMGFGIPLDIWLRGPLKDWAWSLLEDVKKSDRIPFAPIEKRMLEHQSGQFNWQYSLWGILMWQQWENKYIKS